MAAARPITFLTDYGYRDPFAGICRAVIARIAPEALVIDLTHGIARQDVAAGAHALATALPYAPAGVHLAVVDPGVGSPRQAVALRTAEEHRYLVGPDNGLLSLAAERFGGAAEAVEISESPVRLEPVSATFHGRDLFAPVAAHLALGAGLDAVGSPVDPAGLEHIERPEPSGRPGGIEATVAYVDGYGNATLTADSELLDAAGMGAGAVDVSAGAQAHPATIAATFAEVPAGELLVYVNSSGSLTLGVNHGSAAEKLGVGAGDAVALVAR